MSELEKFLEERSKFSIPPGDVARVRLLAKELAIGVHRDLWSSSFGSFRGESILFSNELEAYVDLRWGDLVPSKNLQLLRGYGYLEDKLTPNGNRYYLLTNAAFDLLEETEPFNIFISYKRSESSAFALLVNRQLKERTECVL